MNLKDIAKKAGVSSVTVSNVINGNHKKVSQETIDRVQKIIDEVGYRPNATARSLASKKSRIIAVVMPGLSANDTFTTNPYNNQMLGFLERYIRNKDYYIMTRSVNKLGDVVSLFSTWNVDGIIFLGPYDNDEDDILAKLNAPMVFADSYATRHDIANVAIDDYNGGYLAAKYLSTMGHRDIALVSPGMGESGVIRARYDGFRAGCNEAEIEFSENDIFYSNTFYEEGRQAGKNLVLARRDYTAVFALSDLLALGVMDGIRTVGKKVPEDISVMGFDGIPECDFSYPKLTTISQNLELKAKRLGDKLFEMIESETAVTGTEIINVELKDGMSVIKR